MDIKNSVTENLNELLRLLDKESEFTVDVDEENRGVSINITNQKDGALIGFRGKNLHALERIISLIVNKDLPVDGRYYISVDVNEYKINRDKQLKSHVQGIAQQVLSNGRSYEMPPMTPRERKLVHEAVNEVEGVKSESQGEGENRRVVISLKN